MAKASKQDNIINRTLYRAMDLRGWIVTAAVMLAVWLATVLLPLRLSVLLAVLGMAVSIVGLVISARAIKAGKHDPLFPVWFGGLLVSLFCFISTGSAYTYFREPFYPFWKLSLILGLAIGLLVTVKWVWKHAGFWLRIGSILAIALFAFFMVLLMCCHLNLLLDLTPPAERQMVITDKEEQDNRKSADTYFFEFTEGGETFQLEVGFFEYLQYEVGDTYTFKEYKGAFGKPFYARD